MTPRILIFGTGFVAQAYARALYYLGYYPQMVSRAWCNYTAPKEVAFLLDSARPTHIINCTGYTGNTVDDCQGSEESLDANHITPVMLSTHAKLRSIPFIHISTGCLFMGDGPFTEEHKPNFLENTYQRDKRDAELHILSHGAWVFRIRMPFSQFRHPRNWLCKLEKYDQIIGGLNSVTWIDEFAIRSWQLANKAPAGLYHAAQSGAVSTLDAATLLGPSKALLTSAEEEEFYKTHVRRSEAILDCTKFETVYGTKFTDAWSAVSYCIANLDRGWNYVPTPSWKDAWRRRLASSLIDNPPYSSANTDHHS